MTGKGRPGPEPMPASVFERRRREVAPLCRYCEEHAISFYRLLLKVCCAQGMEGFTKGRVQGLRMGLCTLPDWVIPASCAFLGVGVEYVMGAEWVAEFGVKYGVSVSAIPADAVSVSDSVSGSEPDSAA